MTLARLARLARRTRRTPRPALRGDSSRSRTDRPTAWTCGAYFFSAGAGRAASTDG